MSMMQKIDLKLTDKGCIDKAIKALGWKDLGQGKHNLVYYKKTGFGVDTGKGIFVIDNKGTVHFESDHINATTINKFRARYGAEKAKVDAIRAGYSVQETVVDGRIKIIATEV